MSDIRIGDEVANEMSGDWRLVVTRAYPAFAFAKLRVEINEDKSRMVDLEEGRELQLFWVLNIGVY